MGNREAATREILKWLEKLLPKSKNVEMMRTQLAALSDREFDQFMQKLERGEEFIPLVAPNLVKPQLSLERNLAVAKEMNHDFFERLWLTDATTNQVYLTPKKYLVLELPVRRQQQLLVKKIAIPQHNRSIDDLTGQPTGESKGASISFPELQVLYSQDLDRSIEELIKFRGGDLKAMRAMNQQLVEAGTASQDVIKRTPTKVKSTETLTTILKAMHFDTQL